MFAVSYNNLLLIVEFVLFVTIFVPTMVAFLGGAPWVPTPTARVKKMLELAKIKPGEKVYDLGCGDGRMVILASKLHKANAVGVELSPILYAAARMRNFFSGAKAKFILRDLRRVDLSDADVLMFYLMPETLEGLRKKFIKELKPGVRLVSYAFSIKDWEPSHFEPKVVEQNLARILVYTMPDSVRTTSATTPASTPTTAPTTPTTKRAAPAQAPRPSRPKKSSVKKGTRSAKR